MSAELERILVEVNSTTFGPGALERLDELMEALRGLEDKQKAIEPLLRFIESHPGDDLGAPGPLVHFLEEFHKSGYEPALVKSVERRPTAHNLWMLNRLINGSEEPFRSRYEKVMERVARGTTTPDDLRRLAEEFLSEA